MGVADWLLILTVLLPLSGIVLGTTLTVLTPSDSRIATALVKLALGLSFLTSSMLTVTLVSATRAAIETASIRLGNWLVVPDPGPVIAWDLQANFSAALWMTVSNGIACVVVWLQRQDGIQRPPIAFLLSAASVLFVSNCFVLSTTFSQVLFFWTAISLALLAMCSSATNESCNLWTRRLFLTGVVMDLFLIAAVLLIRRSGGFDRLEDVCSSEGLARIAADNPALPGMIGCLLVLSAIGRCGLFPCFGWHQAAGSWNASILVMTYAVGYVPSAIWLLLKSQPFLVTSEAPISLLGGLGTFGAVLGVFVACGQRDRARRLSFAIASQSGFLLATLGSGRIEAIGWCAWSQCGTSIAAAILLIGSCFPAPAQRLCRISIWIAALSLSGLFPLFGGCSNRALLELNLRPQQLISRQNELPSEGDPAEESGRHRIREVSPHWDWFTGLCIAQGLTTFAVCRFAFEITDEQSASRNQTGSGTNRVADVRLVTLAALVGIVVLTIGGAAAWSLRLPRVVPRIDEIGRLLVAQGVIGLSLMMAWRSHRTFGSASPTNSESIARLIGEGLYVDRVVQTISSYVEMMSNKAVVYLETSFLDSIYRGLFMRFPAWLGRQTESLHEGALTLELMVLLLGTASLFLTLMLM